MSIENSNCCNTESSDCNTEVTSCCTTEQQATPINKKKKIGLSVLLIAITFALFTAFSPNQSQENNSCNVDQENCATSCEPGNNKSNCCSK